MNSPNKTDPRENEILAALPAEEFARLSPNFEYLDLAPLEILYDFNDAVTHVYFPSRNTVVSMLCTTDEQVDVEVALCGNEGVVGLSALFGIAATPYQHLVQVPGNATRIEVDAAKEEFCHGNEFQKLVLRYAHALLVDVSQSALCNRLHSDQERLARWLLLSNDRAASHQLPLPRELLAKMLGRNHSGVSVAAASLERAGFIRYNGAEMEILSRDRLESVVCSYYWVVKRQHRDPAHAAIISGY